MTRARTAGTSLVEVVVALICTVVLAELGLGVLRTSASVERSMRARGDALAARRVSRFVLRTELRRGVPGRDWRAHPPDSLSLRAFRGVARVCPLATPGPGIAVVFGGSRRPAPAKDSVLAVTGEGAWTVHDLIDVATGGGCGSAPGTLETWRLDPPPPPGTVLLRLFESGSYHFTGGALRYRSGRGGRQPITPGAFPPGGAAFAVGPDAVSATTSGIETPHRTDVHFVAWRREP